MPRVPSFLRKAVTAAAAVTGYTYYYYATQPSARVTLPAPNWPGDMIRPGNIHEKARHYTALNERLQIEMHKTHERDLSRKDEVLRLAGAVQDMLLNRLHEFDGDDDKGAVAKLTEAAMMLARYHLLLDVMTKLTDYYKDMLHLKPPAQALVVRDMCGLADLAYTMADATSVDDVTPTQRLDIAKAIDSMRPAEVVQLVGPTRVDELRFVELDDQDGNIRCIVAYEPTRHVALYINVGTNKLINWPQTNFRIYPQDISAKRYGCFLGEGILGRAHIGFNTMADQLFAEIPDEVKHADFHHVLVGHSLGGALASALGAMLANEPNARAASVGSFASPRVFNGHVARRYNDHHKLNCMRFFLGPDIAPTFPAWWFFGYTHVGHPVPLPMPKKERDSFPAFFRTFWKRLHCHSVLLYEASLKEGHLVQTSSINVSYEQLERKYQ